MNKDYWKLTNEDYEFIKGEVIHVFETYQIKCIPVCGFEIASRMKITVIAYSGLSKRKLTEALKTSEDGFLYVDENGHEYIYYNDIDRSYERQNWTILHEIGHIVLIIQDIANMRRMRQISLQNMRLRHRPSFTELEQQAGKIFIILLM